MEPSSKVRERLLLILKVKHDDMLLLMLQMNFIGVGLGPCTGLTDSPEKASMVLRTDPRVADRQKSQRKWMLE